MSHKQPVLICYDVADPKRLRRVFREMKDMALPVQKSVFVAKLTGEEVEKLLARLTPCLDMGEDRLQVFSLRAISPRQSLGLSQATDSIWVV